MIRFMQAIVSHSRRKQKEHSRPEVTVAERGLRGPFRLGGVGPKRPTVSLPRASAMWRGKLSAETVRREPFRSAVTSCRVRKGVGRT